MRYPILIVTPSRSSDREMSLEYFSLKVELLGLSTGMSIRITSRPSSVHLLSRPGLLFSGSDLRTTWKCDPDGSGLSRFRPTVDEIAVTLRDQIIFSERILRPLQRDGRI